MKIENEPQAKNSTKELRNRKLAYQWAGLAKLMNFYFFSGEQSLQSLLVTIAPLRIDQLTSHHRTQTSLKISNEIIINERWINRPQWEIAETLTHELIHVYQEVIPKMKGLKDHFWHNHQFIDISQEIGLHVQPGGGYHEKPADGQFASFMERFGITPPEYVIDDLTLIAGTELRHWWDYDRGQQNGKSTLFKHVCECIPEFSLRNGHRDISHVLCSICEQPFHLVESFKSRPKKS